ncbi:MAG TPA: HAD family hydrolase [Candidatus Dormibacteraeota bacterium]|nr:HAD family hydrolase [Candidatus Dormibacteraeota bacterium]
MSYRAVLFDLFDTLVLFHRERLPEVSVNGRVMRSTAGHLHAAFRPFAPGVELPVFVDALFWSWKEAERIRGESHREVAAPERFGMLFERLGLDSSRVPAEARDLLLATHMRELSRVVECPSHHAPLLAELRQRYRLAVVSNFDYAPTCRAILDREGIAPLFETVVISDEVGWRKPKPVIFETALDRMGLRPSEALFVGDRADIDVIGARGVGMPTVWINREASGLPEDIQPPDFEIRDLDELRAILRIP